MAETALPGIRAAVAIPPSAPAIAARREVLNPDGSAVPDIIAYHHRPEDLGDMSDQTVPDEADSNFFGADGMTFSDLIDIINPLQHIPIVSSIYRALTGDEISPGARIVGGALFGGPIGLGVAVVNAAMEASTGKDFGDTVIATLTAGDRAKPVQVATATAAAAQPAGPAVAATDSDPALLGARTMPVSLLPAAAAPSMPLFGTGMPFGGMGALPFAATAQNTNDPIAAVLQARAAVPMGGPVPGLGRAPLGRVDRLPQRLAMESPPIPAINRRLSDKLTALAAKTAALSRPPPRDESAPGNANASANPSAIEPTAAPAARAQFVPRAAVSQTMLDALDRYRLMKRAELDAPRGG